MRAMPTAPLLGTTIEEETANRIIDLASGGHRVARSRSHASSQPLQCERQRPRNPSRKGQEHKRYGSRDRRQFPSQTSLGPPLHSRDISAANLRNGSNSRRRLLRPRQQQSQQFRPAFAVDDAVDHVGAEPPLERDHGFLRVGHVIAEALEREQEAGVGPERVDQVAGWARQGQAALGQACHGNSSPGSSLRAGATSE